MAILPFLGLLGAAPPPSDEPVSRWLGLKSSFFCPLSSPEAPSSTAAPTLAPSFCEPLPPTHTAPLAAATAPTPKQLHSLSASAPRRARTPGTAALCLPELVSSHRLLSEPLGLWRVCRRLPAQPWVFPQHRRQAVNLPSLPVLQRSSHLLSPGHGSLLAWGAGTLQLGYWDGVGSHAGEKSPHPQA